MKAIQTLAFGAVALLLVQSGSGQYAIGKKAVASGGGSSTGGAYTVTGTIGQFEASPVSGGISFAVGGGFWYGGIPTPGAPGLTIRRLPDSGTVRVSWQDPGSIYVLEESFGPNALQPGSWTPVPGPYPVEGGVFVHDIANPTGSRFFRLVEVSSR